MQTTQIIQYMQQLCPINITVTWPAFKNQRIYTLKQEHLFFYNCIAYETKKYIF